MEGELNELVYNNTPVTFTGSTNNTETSDELTASAIYQDKMGTNYSRGKGVVKAFNFVGISLILTAAAIKTGNLISNVYVLNPPSISNTNYFYEDHVFNYSFTVSNPRKYQVTYFFYVNDKEVMKADCSEEKEYVGSYEGLKDKDVCRFYIEFTNTDYIKTVSEYEFTVED